MERGNWKDELSNRFFWFSQDNQEEAILKGFRDLKKDGTWFEIVRNTSGELGIVDYM